MQGYLQKFTHLKLSIVVLFVFISIFQQTHAWDSSELEIFDVVEEINENFYTVMGIPEDAPLSEVKKAYRTLSKQIHPDKSDAPDAEIKFRQMVSIYEILRDENRRARYDRVLVEGLPDWRSPIYYYRRARKMSILELSIILTVVISITQYLMAWGSYFDKKHTMEEILVKKFRIKDRKKKRPEDFENETKLEMELDKIPRPRWWNVLPVQLVQLTIFLVTKGPFLAHSFVIALKEDKQRREELKKEEENMETRLKEEEERKKERKAQMKSRKRVNNLPDYSGEQNDAYYNPTDEDQDTTAVRQANHQGPVVSGGIWTDDDFSELARLMAKYPGGTTERWDKIAVQMNRTVYEVTKMSQRVMDELKNRRAIEEQCAAEQKLKQKTKGGKTCENGEKVDINLGADELWSVVQQKCLEKALKQFPKGVDQRWDKIARLVPEKAKEECMMRFKFLAEMIRKRKEEREREEGAGFGEETDVMTVPKRDQQSTAESSLQKSSSANVTEQNSLLDQQKCSKFTETSS